MGLKADTPPIVSKDIGNIISCSTLKECGSSSDVLADLGYSMTELKQTGATPCTVVRLLGKVGDNLEMAVGKMIRLGYSIEQLVAEGWNSARFQLKARGSVLTLYKAGYTREDLITLGYTDRLLNRYEINNNDKVGAKFHGVITLSATKLNSTNSGLRLRKHGTMSESQSDEATLEEQ